MVAAKKSAFTSASRAFWMSSSPIGAMQSVGGDMILVFWIAPWTRSASSRVTSEGRRELATPALLQISPATRAETREKSFDRQPLRLRDRVSRKACMSTPSSTP